MNYYGMFEMTREADESNYSGMGKVLEGCVFINGKTVVQWCVEGKPNSTVVYDSFEDFKAIHVDSHPTNGSNFKWL